VLIIGLIVVSAQSAQVLPNPPLKNKILLSTSVPAPTNLTATRTTNGIKLSWQDNSNGKAAFKIERKIGKEGVYQEITSVSAGKSSYEDIVTAGKIYYYRMRAYAGTGKDTRYSAYSNEASLNVPTMAMLNPTVINRTKPVPKISSGTAMPTTPKVLTIPAVINPPGTLTVTGGKAAATPTAMLTIPVVIDAQATLTVTGGQTRQVTATLTIPIVINPTTTLTITGQTP
jgi:hypothetical protein